MGGCSCICQEVECPHPRTSTCRSMQSVESAGSPKRSGWERKSHRITIVAWSISGAEGVAGGALADTPGSFATVSVDRRGDGDAGLMQLTRKLRINGAWGNSVVRRSLGDDRSSHDGDGDNRLGQHVCDADFGRVGCCCC